MNIPLLFQLRDAAGEFLGFEALGPDWEVTSRDLAELASFGFELEEHPTRGVAYRGPAARLCPDQIEFALGTRLIGRRIAVWDRVGSTNDLALRAAASRANEGLVVLAESQTQGRGRRGRSWTAAPQTSILMSFLVFPRDPLAHLDGLTALGAVAVAEVVEQLTGTSAQIKWPNDVLVRGKKIAGILVEVDRTGGVVIGIGLNVNTRKEELPDELMATTTSMRDLTGSRLDRSEVVRGLIRRLDAWYAEGLEDGTGHLNSAWKSRSKHVGTIVCVETKGGIVLGRVIELDLVEGLLLELDADGSHRRIPSVMIYSLASEKLLEAVDPGC